MRIQNAANTVENSLVVSQKLNTELPPDPAIPWYKAAGNIQIQVFLGTYISSLAGDISRSGTAGSHG